MTHPRPYDPNQRGVVELSSCDSVAVLTFSEQPQYPRLSREMLAELSDRFHAVRSSGGFRGVVIAANSHSFVTGAELREVADLSGVAAFEFARLGQSLFREIARSALPVVAAIRGFCLGGGLDLALACHERVAAYDASLGYPAAALGLVTGWGGTRRLPGCVGPGVALQIMATGERVPATQALTMGLVDELAPSIDLVSAAAGRARRAAQESGRERAFLGSRD
ncbi:MAG TPA: enoyl-CoA hydratase/isomerase family protein [Terriglobia bacterium]|nr:enoyl-CoA hydratase/isomerase family protein [Terriglobia bacterium]